MTRTCARPDCNTVLSSMNTGDYCWPCEDNGRVPDEKDRPPLCGICGVPFVKAYFRSRYCSDECRKEAHRRSNRAWHPNRVRV